MPRPWSSRPLSVRPRQKFVAFCLPLSSSRQKTEPPPFRFVWAAQFFGNRRRRTPRHGPDIFSQCRNRESARSILVTCTPTASRPALRPPSPIGADKACGWRFLSARTHSPRISSWPNARCARSRRASRGGRSISDRSAWCAARPACPAGQGRGVLASMESDAFQ
jgi:hypothetical protein